MNRLVEIRSYKLKPGRQQEFHSAVIYEVMPLLRAAMDVVSFGPSAHEADTYYLVRAYADLADLQAQQNAFYGSSAWRSGPREAILDCIESFLNTVLWLSPAAVDDLRRNNPAPK
jgi:NIPSNAP